MQNKYAANIRFRANIRLIFPLTGEYLLQSIRLEADSQNFKRISQLQANICLHILAHQRIFDTYCFKLYRKAFTSLRPHLEFGFGNIRFILLQIIRNK
jgi:hypothetical protein